jgi:hypothetical protein
VLAGVNYILVFWQVIVGYAFSSLLSTAVLPDAGGGFLSGKESGFYLLHGVVCYIYHGMFSR